MKYSFIDWDKREYTRETKENTKFSSRSKNGDKISLNMIDGEDCVIKLNLNRKEAKAISLSIEAALYDINLEIIGDN